ncbi:MAG TPA: 16S rRNA (cytidine(1402)-2'-O)-methyltransferase [Acidimicrobiales bacterium]
MTTGDGPPDPDDRAFAGPDDVDDLDEFDDLDDLVDLDDPVLEVLPASGGAGALVVVGTPIGNLGDLSPRAAAALASAQVLYCEDTRHSRKLLSHAGISGVPLRSLHEHNEVDRVDEVVAAVASGRTVALVSDAGMPAVSDPGARVVAAVAAAGLAVTVVPGPSAVLAALVASGLATDRFCFEGFLPRSGRDRTERLAVVATEPRTTVLFEAPGRVAATLADLAAVCGDDRSVAVARELTKLHEEVWRGTLTDGAAWAADGVRGEVVLVLAGAPAVPDAEVGDDELAGALTERLEAGARTRGAVDEVAMAYKVPRRRVYELALRLRAGDGPE